MMELAAARQLFERFVAALADPAGGEALYDLHDPDALLLFGGRSHRAAEIDRAAFARDHEDRAGALHEQGLGLPAGEVTIDHLEPGVIWGLVADPHRATPNRVGLGITENGRVAWAVLAPDAHITTAGQGRALAHGEFPFLSTHAVPANRHWLDVAYRRRYQSQRPPLMILPGAAFACQGGGECCRAGVEITVPPEAQGFIDALPMAAIAPELTGTRLEEKGDGQLILKRRADACRFLDDANRCRIHMHLGTPVFTPCGVFPYRFTETPDGVAVTVSNYCNAVRACEGPPLETQTEEIYRRLTWAGGPMFAARPPRLTRDAEPEWESFKAAEAELRAALRLTDLPLHRRLWIGARMLQARLEGRQGDPDAFALEPLAPLPEDDRALVDASLGYPIAFLAMLEPGLEPANDLHITTTRLAAEDRFARWLENVHFAKDLSYTFGLATANALVVLLYVFWLSLEGGLARHDELLFRAFGRNVDHRIVIPPLQQLFELVPDLRARLDEPAFAPVLLRWVNDRARQRQ